MKVNGIEVRKVGKKLFAGKVGEEEKRLSSVQSSDLFDGLVVLCGHDVGCPFARQANGTCTATVDCPYMKHNARPHGGREKGQDDTETR